MRMLLAPEPDIPTRRHTTPPVRLEDISVADVLARLEQDNAPGFEATAPSPPRPLPTVLDLRGRDLAEQYVLAWWAQQRQRGTGQRFGLLQSKAPQPDLAACFPDTFEPLRPSDLDAGDWSVWHPGPVWLTATNAFAQHQQATALRAAAEGRARVLVHLADAAGRQGALAVDVWSGLTGDGGSPSLLGEMLASDAWMGGCDGLDHLWALMRPRAPQLALSQRPEREEASWATVQRGLCLPQSWSRWPLNPNLSKVETAAERPSDAELAAGLVQLLTSLANTTPSPGSAHAAHP